MREVIARERAARRKRGAERSKQAGYRQEKGLVSVGLTLSEKLAKEACERCPLCGETKRVWRGQGLAACVSCHPPAS